MTKKIANQTNFITEFGEVFMNANSMRLTKSGHDILRKQCQYLKIDLRDKTGALTDKTSALQEATLHDKLKYPWFMERRRRTDRSGPKNIDTYVTSIYFYGDEKSATLLKMNGCRLDKWTKSMNDSVLWRTFYPKSRRTWETAQEREEREARESEKMDDSAQ